MQNMEWYENLIKPAFSPPSWVFMPVWTVLYILMFISLALFIKSDVNSSKTIPLIIFSVQLILNMLWTPTFFYLKKIGLALIINILLWISVLTLIILFYKFTKLGALLFIPYLLWNTFAIYLNLMYWKLN